MENDEKRYQKNIYRIEFLDVAKGLAVLLVIVGHMPDEYIKSEIKQWIYSFHVPVFFIISGVIMGMNVNWIQCGIKDFIRKKTVSLLKPYLIYSVLSLVVVGLKNGLIVVFKYIIWVFCGVGIGTLWFLPVLWGAEIIFVLIKKRVKRERRVICLLAFVVVLYNYLNISDSKNMIIHCIGLVTNVWIDAIIGFFFVSLGYYFCICYQKHKLQKRKMIILMLLFFSISFLLYRYNDVDVHYARIGNPILFLINAVVGSVGLIIFSKYISGKSKVMCFLGKNSLIIYATHMNFNIVHLSEKMVLLLNTCRELQGLLLLLNIIVIEMLFIGIVYIKNRKYIFKGKTYEC